MRKLILIEVGAGAEAVRGSMSIMMKISKVMNKVKVKKKKICPKIEDHQTMNLLKK